MTKDCYQTISDTSEGLFKSKGSKFLSFAFPVHSEEDIKSILEIYRKKYHDARHHCYAWALGPDRNEFRTNDDGEPSNSAGKPIFGQILAFDVTNILIVVVRYFGGTLLGVGGLISAYKLAALDALANAKIIQKTVNALVELQCDYDLIDSVNRFLKGQPVTIEKQWYEMDCKLLVSVRQGLIDDLVDNLKKIHGVNIKMR